MSESLPQLVPGLLVLTMWLHGATAAGGADYDEAKGRALGIRRVEGRHLILFTDLPSSPDVDELPQVFDAAIAPWSAYFQIPSARVADWRVECFLMRDAERFRGCGMLPAGLPEFANGFSRPREAWVHAQQQAYYQRHLLLHEGTHAFSLEFLGAMGPPWYGEGLAELLATHRWESGRLTLGVVPRDRESSAGWGRIKIIKDELAARRGMSLPAIQQYSSRAHLQVEPYGWCWAAAAFLDGHPAYQDTFRSLRADLGLSVDAFQRRFWERIGANQGQLTLEWQVFVMSLEYGHDIAREAIEFRSTKPLAATGGDCEIRADRGWQSSGLRLEAGRTYRLTADGQFQVADRPRPWLSEANGVTLEYHAGQPLGLLLAAVHDESRPPQGLSTLCRPTAIGLDSTLTPAESGTLFLRINDSPASLGDNAGSVRVHVE